MPGKGRLIASTRTSPSPYFFSFLGKLFYLVDRAPSRIEFLKSASRLILDLTGADALELRVLEPDKFYRCAAQKSERTQPVCAVEPFPKRLRGKRQPLLNCTGPFEKKLQTVFAGDAVARRPFRAADKTAKDKAGPWNVAFCLQVNARKLGLVVLRHRRREFFSPAVVKFCQGVTDVLGMTLVHQRVLAALRERVKEETCLFSISKLMVQKGSDPGVVLQGIANVVPPGWRHPEVASCRIEIDDKVYTSPNFRDGPARQTEPILVNGEVRGRIEVVYSAERPAMDEGPFLEEERNLISSIAQQIGLLLEESKAVEEQARMQEQLRHSDRLATIGQLAGGVAHELNEPLAGILGFTQLVLRNRDLPESTIADLERIRGAALHSREVIRKLLIFGRRVPTTYTSVDMNKVVEEALSILAPHLVEQHVKLKTSYSPVPPTLQADRSQMIQVVINLAVNSLQAMRGGGILTVETRVDEETVTLLIEDTGTGMDADTLGKIFEPFFTTKDVHQGTGLGLAVVHGIVTGHRGTIQVESKPGAGARFILAFPTKAASEPERSGE